MKASLLLFLSSANAATQLDLPQVNNFVSPILYYNILYPVHINCSIPKLMEQSEKFNFQNCLLLWVSHKVQLSGKTFAWRLHLAWNLECVYIYIYIYIYFMQGVIIRQLHTQKLVTACCTFRPDTDMIS